jgi:hypothetical protein
LHVECLVKDSNLWDLLRALELHKAGNVEVRPVAPPLSEQPLALPPPAGAHGGVQATVRAALRLKQPIKLAELARSLGIKRSSASSALHAMMKQGLVKNPSIGVYVRVKPDQRAKPAVEDKPTAHDEKIDKIGKGAGRVVRAVLRQHNGALVATAKILAAVKDHKLAPTTLPYVLQQMRDRGVIVMVKRGQYRLAGGNA